MTLKTEDITEAERRKIGETQLKVVGTNIPTSEAQSPSPEKMRSFSTANDDLDVDEVAPITEQSGKFHNNSSHQLYFNA